MRQFIDDRQVDPGEADVHALAHSLGPTFYIPTEDEWDQRRPVAAVRRDAVPAARRAGTGNRQHAPSRARRAAPVIDAALRLCSDFLEGGAAELPCTEAHVREFMAYIFDADVDPGALTGLVDEEAWQAAARPAAETQCAPP